MSIRVGQLVSELRQKSRVINVNMGDVALLSSGDNSGMLRVGSELLPWGDRTAQMFNHFVKGPGYKYLTNQSLDWQSTVVAHHAELLADNPSVWQVAGSAVEGIYHPEDKIIPLVSVAERLSNVFDSDDMAEVLYAPDQVEINVWSNLRTVTVPGIPGHPDRPLEGEVDHPVLMKVGDLSAGGVRVVMQPGKPDRAPFVEELWWRCFCTNQMTRRINGSQINLRGRTVDELLLEMENVARAVFEGLEQSGQRILHSAETPIPGTVSDFIRVTAREHGLNANTVLRLQERAASLPPNPSVYDVNQIITALAIEDGVQVGTRRKLQAMGGDMSLDADKAIHRCATCERPLES